MEIIRGNRSEKEKISTKLVEIFYVNVNAQRATELTDVAQINKVKALYLR